MDCTIKFDWELWISYLRRRALCFLMLSLGLFCAAFMALSVIMGTLLDELQDTVIDNLMFLLSVCILVIMLLILVSAVFAVRVMNLCIHATKDTLQQLYSGKGYLLKYFSCIERIVLLSECQGLLSVTKIGDGGLCFRFYKDSILVSPASIDILPLNIYDKENVVIDNYGIHLHTDVKKYTNAYLLKL